MKRAFERRAERIGAVPCCLIGRLPAKTHKVMQKVRHHFCASEREGHQCQGALTIRADGIVLSCPLCGDCKHEGPKP